MKKLGSIITLGILLIAIPAFVTAKTVNTASKAVKKQAVSAVSVDTVKNLKLGDIGKWSNFVNAAKRMYLLPIDMTIAYSVFRDIDLDGYSKYYGTASFGGLPNPFANLGDCDDNNAAINPGATEIWYDNIDENCDEANDFDQDYDGYQDEEVLKFTSSPKALARTNGKIVGTTKPIPNIYDCNDTDPLINPGASECNDGVDQNCNGSSDEKTAPSRGTYYLDSDTDAYGNPAVTTVSCGMPAGYANNNTDCNDSNNLMNPGMTEYCNGFDDDCDLNTDESDASDATNWYADTDSDTYGNPALTQKSCTQPTNYVNNNTDCNDSNNTVYPGATDAWYDGIDANCDGLSDYDQDVDGYDSNAYSGTDCNDTDNTIHPLATETWYDGIDQNCNGDDDYDQDVDTYQYDLDPTDGTTATYPHDGYDCDDSDSAIGTGDYFECFTHIYFTTPPPGYEPWVEGYLCDGECYDLGDNPGSIYCRYDGHYYGSNTLCWWTGSADHCEICTTSTPSGSL